MPAPTLQVVIQARASSVVRLLYTAIGVLAAGHLAAEFCSRVLGHDDMFGLYYELRLDCEGNIATWYSSSLLLSAACLCGVFALVRRRQPGGFAFQWMILAAALAYLSLDETSELHEKLTPILWRLGIGQGHYAVWVLPMAALACAVGSVCAPMLLRLPRPALRGILLAGCVYVGAAGGLEVVGSLLKVRNGIPYTVEVAAEECLEMVGEVVLIRTLLDLAEIEIGLLTLAFSKSRDDSPGPGPVLAPGSGDDR